MQRNDAVAEYGELAHREPLGQPAALRFATRNVGIKVGIRAFEIRVRDETGKSTMIRPRGVLSVGEPNSLGEPIASEPFASIASSRVFSATGERRRHQLHLRAVCAFSQSVPELHDALVCERMVSHLLQHLERNGCDMRARKRSLRYVQRTADRRRQHLRGHVVPREYLDELAYDGHAVFVDIVEATDERTDEARAGLRCQQALVRTEDEGAVRRDAVLRQG